MMRRVWLLVAMLGPAAVDGQSDSARIRELERSVGSPTRVFTRDEPCPYILPNGEYDVFCRQRKLNFAIDALVAERDSLRSENASLRNWIAGIASRLGVVESKIAGTVGPIIAPFSNGNDLIIPTGRLILGNPLDCQQDAASQIQICGKVDANIHVESNIAGGQWQNSAKHVGMWSFSADGGLRMIQNKYQTKNCFQDFDPSTTPPTPYTNCLKVYDPNQTVGIFGPDSKSQFSWKMELPGVPHEYTQDLILTSAIGVKCLCFLSPLSGVKIEFSESTGYRTFDVWKGLVPKQ